MTILALAMIFFGLAMVVAGFVVPDRLRAPFDGFVAFLAPMGLVVVLTGVLLVCVPDFFGSTRVFGASSFSEPGEAP